VKRSKRGRYRLLRPSERPDLRGAEWRRVREILLNGPEPKAWDGPTAVEAWTDGGYVLSPSAFARVYHLAVPIDSLPTWRAYLRGHGVALNTRKRVGARVELRGVSKLRPIRLGEEPVIARAEVLRVIRAHPGLYANAEGLLRDRSS
jgi:hypothetical protein